MADDIVTPILGVVVAGITALFLWIQIAKQTKVDSATFSMTFFDKVLKDNTVTINHIRDRHKDNSTTPYDEKQIRLLLNQFEYMARFWQDGVLKLSHITNMFGKTLRNIKKDTEIQNIISKEQEYNPRAYTEIKKLLDKIDD